MQTSIPDIYAVGECASWENQTFGIIAPGIEMADVLSYNLTHPEDEQRGFDRPDLSTKLKLLGVDVASFGDFFADRDGPKYLPGKQPQNAKGVAPRMGTEPSRINGPLVKALTYLDPFAAVYKKYLFTLDGKHVLGGMMIGDTKDYVKLNQMVKSQKELEVPPSQFILGSHGGGDENANDLYDSDLLSSGNSANYLPQGRRYPDLLLPQRHERRCGQQCQRWDLQNDQRGQVLYESRNRMRWLYAPRPIYF